MSALPPLAGLRVVDFSQVAAGPYATSLLGDLGADVVKVEGGNGDPFRQTDEIFGEGESGYFYGINRSKRCVTLDLHHPRKQEVLEKLVLWADVVIVGFRPDAVSRLGLDYNVLGEINPRVIYCSLTAFGEDGPRASEPGMDILAQALSGVMGTTGEPGRPPVKVGPPIADFVCSYLLGFAVCAALVARERDGVGQKISVNLLDGQLASMANYITPFLRNRIPIRPVGGGHPQLVPYQVFQTQGGYIVVACLSDKFWPPLVSALDMPALGDEQRFSTNAGRVGAREEIVGALQEKLLTRPADYWLQRLTERGVPCGPVHRLEDALEDPQVIHNKMISELKHPVYGKYGVVNNPMHFERTPTVPFGYAPSMGEHNREVLTELGFKSDEIADLANDGVLN